AACGSFLWRIGDARFGAFPLRFHGAVHRPYGSRGGGRRGGGGAERSRVGTGDAPRRRAGMVAGDRAGQRAENHRATAVRRARRSSGRAAPLRGLAPRAGPGGARSGNLERQGGRMGGGGRWGGALAVRAGVPGGGARLTRAPRGGPLGEIGAALVPAGASVASSALVGGHASRYMVSASGLVASRR